MRYFSLFTGIGGLEWGLEGTGVECVGFSETKESSVRIYERHYPGRKNFGDITAVKSEDLPDFDLLTGGFPCQSFSLAGVRKGFKDRRGQMIFYIYDILKEKKPRYAVLENVRGLLTHDKGRTYGKVFRLLQVAGYRVRALMLNAINYGSAQSRDRLFFLCSREDFPIVIPEVMDNSRVFRDFRDTDRSRFEPVKSTPKNEMRLHQKTGYDYDLIGGYDRVGTLTTAKAGGGGLKPSSQPKVIQEEDGTFRWMTPWEGERLQGFPDGWTEGESVADRWFAIGNAVNCGVSDYLFNNYLPKVWVKFQKKI